MTYTLITGASGLVGSAVAKKLVSAGHRVRALVRSTSPRAHLAELDLEYAIGDIRDAESVRRAMVGARYVFHVAADYRLWARDPREIYAANVDGTRIMMQEALNAGVERVVYTSSVATLALPKDGTAADESVPLTIEAGIGAYKRSKIAAERVVEAMVAEHQLPAVIVNPSTPIGARDVHPTPTGRVLVEAANGRMPAYVETGLNLVHVEDVALGHILAAEKGQPGRRYVLGGQDVPLSAMLAEIARQTGRKPPRIRLPVAPLFPLALVAEGLGQITGREPFVTLDALRMARHHMYYTSARAEAELGYTARPWQQAVAEALGWFRMAGMIK